MSDTSPLPVPVNNQGAALPVPHDELSVDAVLGWLTKVQQLTKGARVRIADYDAIPGTQRPTLLKPGAENLCIPVGCRTGSAAPWLLTGADRVVVSLMAFSFAFFLVCGRNN